MLKSFNKYTGGYNGAEMMNRLSLNQHFHSSSLSKSSSIKSINRLSLHHKTVLKAPLLNKCLLTRNYSLSPSPSSSSSSFSNNPNNITFSFSFPSFSFSLPFNFPVDFPFPSLFKAGRVPPKKPKSKNNENEAADDKEEEGLKEEQKEKPAASETKNEKNSEEENSDKEKQNSNEDQNDNKDKQDKEKDEDKDKKNKKKRNLNDLEEEVRAKLMKTTAFVSVVSFAFAYYIASSLFFNTNQEELTWQEFRTNYLETGQVHHLVVDPGSKSVSVYLNKKNASDALPGSKHYFNIGSIEAFERLMSETQKELEIDPHDFIPIKYIAEPSTSTKDIISGAVNIITAAAMIYFVYRGMNAMSGMGGMGGGGKGGRNIFSIGKSPAQVFKPGEYTKVTFADVAGLDEAKVEVMEFVQFLKDPQKFTKLGAKVPKGALLCGPPGTGKTLLAKAMAGEASVPFFSISGSDFIEMFVGVGPSRVRDLFAEARKQAPCIIFIDEIDAVGRERGKGKFGGNDERENTLNQMLVEMDGFQPNEGVVVLAGTNRKDILDPALLRPGRFDRTITIDRPDLRGREQIFNVHLKKILTNVKKTELAPRLAALTPGFAGADIANLCNEAALIAARLNKESVELVDFEQAADRIIGGLEKKNSVMTVREKTLVAYHEAGHAVIGWFLQHCDPVLKVTIVPRGSGALGFAQYLPNELHLYQQDQLLDMMCMALGGRAAENLFFGKVSTGASDDLKRVTQIAMAQIAQYGMSDRLGNVSYAQEDEGYQKPFSESTGELIDEEVRNLVSNMYKRTQELAETYKEQIKALAVTLLEKETVNHDVLVQVLGPRPYPNDAYQRYLDSIKKTLSPNDETSASAKEGESKADSSNSTTNASPDSPNTPEDPKVH